MSKNILLISSQKSLKIFRKNKFKSSCAHPNFGSKLNLVKGFCILNLEKNMRKNSIKSNQKNILRAIKIPDTKPVQIKIPLDLVGRIYILKKDATEMGHTFNLNEICVLALKEAVEIGEQELKKLLESSGLKKIDEHTGGTPNAH